MRHAKRMPHHDVLVLDARILISRDPGGQALRGTSRVLRHVPAGGEFLFVGVLGDVQGVAREARAVPDQAAFFRHQAGDFAGDELVGHGVVRVGVELVGVGDVPGSACVVVADAGGLGFEGGFPRLESVAVAVRGAADGGVAGDGVDFEDGVGVAVDGGVEAQAEEVLVVVRVDARIDLGAVGGGGLLGGEGVGGEDAGEFDFELDDPVLVHGPVDTVFVVACGEDLADDKFAGTGGGRGGVAEVGVFEEDAIVFFVDADCVFDGVGFAVSRGGQDVSDRL